MIRQKTVPIVFYRRAGVLRFSSVGKSPKAGEGWAEPRDENTDFVLWHAFERATPAGEELLLERVLDDGILSGPARPLRSQFRHRSATIQDEAKIVRSTRLILSEEQLWWRCASSVALTTCGVHCNEGRIDRDGDGGNRRAGLARARRGRPPHLQRSDGL